MTEAGQPIEGGDSDPFTIHEISGKGFSISIEATLNGERRIWDNPALQRELLQHAAKYPAGAYDYLKQRVEDYKAPPGSIRPSNAPAAPRPVIKASAPPEASKIVIPPAPRPVAKASRPAEAAPSAAAEPKENAIVREWKARQAEASGDLPGDINPASVRIVETLDPTIWPEGGGVPIDRYTFTEDKALELGIVFENERGKIQVRIHEAASFIMERIAFANIRTGDNVELHYYDQGTYRKLAEGMIGLAAEQLLGQYANNKNVTEIVGKVKRSYHPVRTDDQNPEGWLCLKNGYFNINTRGLEPHHPGRIFTGQLPVTYDPGKKCRHFGKFLLEVADLPTDPQAILELMGYCLMPGYPYQHIFILLGEGANGKGTLIRVLMAVLGSENVSKVTLHTLATPNLQRFAAIDMFGKMANLAGDLDAGDLKNTGLIKMACGEDELRADRKGISAISFKNQAKIIASCNKIPYSQDDSDGFIRRPIVFYFPNQFSGDKRDVKLVDRLTTEEEKSAIFNEMLNGLDRLKMNNAFTGREDPKFEAERYLIMQNSAKKFLVDCCMTDIDHTEEGRFISAFKEGKDDLFRYYLDWCVENGYPKMKKGDFNAEVLVVFSNVYESQQEVFNNPKKKSERCWVGIRYDPEGASE